MLEEAVGGVVLLDQLVALVPRAVGVEQDELAGFHVPDQLAAERVDRRRLACEHVAVVELPETERAVPLRVADPEHGLVVHHRQRVGAVDSVHRALDRTDEIGVEQIAGEVVGDHLGVAVGGERVPLSGQLLADLAGVDEVPVVTQRERARAEGDGKRLCAGLVDAAGRRVADVAHASRALEAVEVVLLERLADQPHLDVVVLLEPVVGDDPRRLLAAVLERVQAVVTGVGGPAVLERDTDDATLLPHPVGRPFGRTLVHTRPSVARNQKPPLSCCIVAGKWREYSDTCISTAGAAIALSVAGTVSSAKSSRYSVGKRRRRLQ